MATETEEQGFVKVIFDVQDKTFGVGGEGVWAKPLGNDLYEIRNTPWHTCEINWGDVVKAIPEAEDQWPTLREVVRRSGHRTLHLFFLKQITQGEKDKVLGQLKAWKASYENSDGSLYAIDVAPEGDFDGLCDYLDQWGKGDKLDYRTAVPSE